MATLWLLLALVAFAAAGCSDSDSLGDEPITVVEVGNPPVWSNGVGELMQLKCGVCHQVPRADISPIETPQGFDLNYHIVSPTGVPGAKSIIGDFPGILQGEADERMPPSYATPLAKTEQAALINWAAGGGN